MMHKKLVSIWMIALILALPGEFALALSINYVPESVDISSGQAVFDFTTDESTQAKIYYGTTAAAGLVSNQSSGQNHKVKLDSLLYSKQYHYYLSATNGVDTVRLPSVGTYTFQSAKAPDNIPPQKVGSLKATASPSRISLEWVPPQDDDIKEYVVYRSGNKLSTVKNSGYTDTTVDFEISYNYEVFAIDTSGNEGPKTAISITSLSKDYRPLQLVTNPPTIVGTAVKFEWVTDSPSTAKIYYGLTELDQVEELTNLTQSGELIIGDLLENTKYNYRVTACDEFKNCANSTLSTFTTSDFIEHNLVISSPKYDENLNYVHDSILLSISGTTSPGSVVRGYVDGLHKRTDTAKSDGSFTLNNLALFAQSDRSIKVESKNIFGETQTIEFSGFADLIDPDVELNNISRAISESYFELSGNISENSDFVEVSWKINYKPNFEGPKPPTNLNSKATTPNSIALSWNEVEGALGYVIYREDVGSKPARIIDTIASGSTKSYDDSSVSTDSEYVYFVAAYGPYDVIGEPSQVTRRKTVAGGEVIDTSSQEKQFPESNSNSQIIDSVNYEGFLVRVGPFNEGRSEYIITFKDAAKRSHIEQGELIYDTAPPRWITPSSSSEFISLNSPTVDPVIPISGQIDSKSTVYIFVGDIPVDDLTKATHTIETTDEGFFNATLDLGSLHFSAKFSDADPTLICSNDDFDNNGIPEWQDSAKKYPEILTQDDCVAKKYGQSSSASIGASLPTAALGIPEEGVDTRVTMIAVDEANQRSDAITGEISFVQCDEGTDWNVDIDYPYPSSINPREALEGIASLGIVYELIWRGPGTPGRVTGQPILRAAPLGLNQLEKYDQPNDWISNPVARYSSDKLRGSFTFAITPNNFLSTGNETIAQMERNISSHRLGECEYLGNKVGCMKLLLQLEVPYTSDVNTDNANNFGSANSRVQKQCVVIDVPFDQRFVDPDDIPKAFLNFSVEALGTIIDGMEAIYTPIKFLSYAFYASCGVNLLVTFALRVSANLRCKYSGDFLDSIKQAIAGGEFESAAQQSSDNNWLMCEAYAAGKRDRNTEEYNQIVDACKECSAAKEKVAKSLISQGWFCDRVMCPSVPTLQEYIRSKDKTIKGGRASPEKQNSLGPSEQLKVQSSCHIGNSGGPVIERLYNGANEGGDSANVKCTYSNSADPLLPDAYGGNAHNQQCCVDEYLGEWKSGSPMTDPVKMSYCLAYPQADGCGPTNFANGITGICQPNDKGAQLSAIKTGASFNNNFRLEKGLVNNEVWYYVDSADKGEEQRVLIGYVKDSFELAEGAQLQGDTIKVTGNKQFVQIAEVSDSFTQIPPGQEDNVIQTAKSSQVSSFQTKLQGTGAITIFDASKAHKEIQDNIGSVERKYLLQPTASLMQSFMTLCLTGIMSYLGKWIRILKMLQMCFQSILLTGDGSAGQCEAIVSQYICDLVFEALSCFVNRYGESGTRLGGIGGIISAVSDASDQSNAQTAARYGENNLFAETFSTKNLAKAACIFAFTGEFPTDMFNIFDQNLELDINTTAWISPARRRFQNYDFEGKPRYTYDIGYTVFPGADISYDVTLVCSGPERECPDSANGLCDCATIGENVQKELSLGYAPEDSCSGRANKARNEACTGHILKPIESWVRYDHVRICWQPMKTGQSNSIADTTQVSNNPLAGCQYLAINDVGGMPAFCSYDSISGHVSCGIDLGQDNTAELRETKTTRDVFTVGDKNILDIKAALNTPELEQGTCTQDCEFTKYLEIIIFNKDGRAVYPSARKTDTNVLRLNGRDIHDLTFYDPFEFASLEVFEINKDMFAQGSGSGTCVKDRYNALGLNLNCAEMTTDGIYVFQTDSAGVLKFGFIPGQFTQDTFYSQANLQSAQTSMTSCQKDANSNRQTCTSTGTKTLTVIPNTPILPKNQFTYAMYASPSRVEQIVDCSATEEIWKAQVTLYDAEQDGINGWKRGRVISRDHNDKEQRRTVDLKVRCAGGESETAPLANHLGTITLTKEHPSSERGVFATGLFSDDKVEIYSSSLTDDKRAVKLEVASYSANPVSITVPLTSFISNANGVTGVSMTSGSSVVLLSTCPSTVANVDGCYTVNSQNSIEIKLEKTSARRVYSIELTTKVEDGLLDDSGRTELTNCEATKGISYSCMDSSKGLDCSSGLCPGAASVQCCLEKKETCSEYNTIVSTSLRRVACESTEDLANCKYVGDNCFEA